MSLPQQQKDMEAQKAALLAAIAQQGSAGQQAFQAEAQRRQEAQKAAVQQIAQQSQMTGAAGSAPKAATQQLQGMQSDLGSVYAQDAAMSQAAFKGSIDASSAANAAYMQAAGAALPVVNAQTQGTIAQIRAEQEAARAEREYQERMRRLEAEEAEKERAFRDRERTAAERAEAQALTEEEVGKKQDRIVANVIRNESGVVADVFAKATDPSISANPDEAIRYATRLLDEEAENGQEVSDEDRRKMYGYIYEYFVGKKAPSDFQKLGELFAAEGVVVPGYVPKPTLRDVVDAAKATEALGESIKGGLIPRKAATTAQSPKAKAGFAPAGDADPQSLAYTAITSYGPNGPSVRDVALVEAYVRRTGLVPMTPDAVAEVVGQPTARTQRSSGGGEKESIASQLLKVLTNRAVAGY